MFQLETFKNILRKQTSTNIIKENEESRKKVYETTEKEIIFNKIAKVMLKAHMYY